MYARFDTSEGGDAPGTLASRRRLAMPYGKLPARRWRSQLGRGAVHFLFSWLLISFVVPALALFLGCKSSPTPGGGSPTDLTYLRTAAEDWDRLFNSQDTSKLSALYAEEAISMPFNAPTVRGRKGITFEKQQFFAQNTGKHETFVDEILTHEDWAIERARYTLTFAPKPS